MVKEFYKSGDCTKTASIKLVSAKVQQESAEEKHDVNDQNLYTITLDTPPQKEMYGEEMTFVEDSNER